MSSRILGTGAFVVGIVLIAISVYFFLESITYISGADVVTGLLSAVIGFVTLTSGTTLIRSFLISKVAETK